MAYQPEHATVWGEIRVRDLDAAACFYAAVTGLTMTRCEDPMPMAFFEAAEGGVAGHLSLGEPAAEGAGPVVHLAAEGTLDAISARVAAAGGRVTSDPIPVPDGRFIYVADPDGNTVGLFERA
ncbi:MAG: VOC family protein [Pseudomonadota bacterium]